MNPNNKSKSVFKTNVIYGLLVLVPISIIFLVLAKVVEILEKTALSFNLESTFSLVTAVMLSLLLLLLISFTVGFFVRTRIGSLSLERLENKILYQIPGYEIIRNILKGFAEKRTAYQAAMIQLYGQGTAVLGFIMEENDNDRLTVFVPLAPTLMVGSLHLVNRERVTILEAESMDVMNCISQWGVGSQKILGRNMIKEEGSNKKEQ